MTASISFYVKIRRICAIYVAYDLRQIPRRFFKQNMIVLCEAPHYVKLILSPS